MATTGLQPPVASEPPKTLLEVDSIAIVAQDSLFASTDFKQTPSSVSLVSDESNHTHRSSSSMHSISPFKLEDNHHHHHQQQQQHQLVVDSFSNQHHQYHHTEQFKKKTSTLNQCSVVADTSKQVHHQHQHQQQQIVAHQTLNDRYTFCSVCKKQDAACDCGRHEQAAWSSSLLDSTKLLLVDKQQQQQEQHYSSPIDAKAMQLKFSSGQQSNQPQYGYASQVQLSSSHSDDQNIMTSVTNGDCFSTLSNQQLNYSYTTTAQQNESANHQDWSLFNDRSTSNVTTNYALDECDSHLIRTSQSTDQVNCEVKNDVSDLDSNNNNCSYTQPEEISYREYQQHFQESSFEVSNYFHQPNCSETPNYNQQQFSTQHELIYSEGYYESFNRPTQVTNNSSQMQYALVHQNQLAKDSAVTSLKLVDVGSNLKELDCQLKSSQQIVSTYQSNDAFSERATRGDSYRYTEGNSELQQQQPLSSYFCEEQPRYENKFIPDQSGDLNSIQTATNPNQSIDSQQILIKPKAISRTRRGRPRKKGQRCRDKVNGKLWEFIRDLLLSDLTNPNFIRWERREDGVFKFVQSDKVAKMWGERKQNPKMTYEKLSRAMRYYYKTKVLLPVFGRRLVYKFGPNATGWKQPNIVTDD